MVAVKLKTERHPFNWTKKAWSVNSSNCKIHTGF